MLSWHTLTDAFISEYSDFRDFPTRQAGLVHFKWYSPDQKCGRYGERANTSNAHWYMEIEI